MERSRWTVLTAGVALAIAGASSTVTFAVTFAVTCAVTFAATFAQTVKAGQAQPAGQATQPSAQAAPPADTSPMVKPPESASGSSGSSNPDNMPIKRPSQPTNDRMTHEPPASGANAK